MIIAPLGFSPFVAAQIRESRDCFIVTGAGGWFGKATLEMLETACGSDFENRVLAFASAERPSVLRSGRTVMLRPLSALSEFSRPNRNVHIAHYAFLTREKVGPLGEDRYVANNRAITAFIAAQAERLGVNGLFLTSSGAVYKKDHSLDADLKSNPYGALKLEEEKVFTQLQSALGARAAICRVFNVSGPYLNKDYALGDLISAALFEDQLKIYAQHKVYRSYAHVKDIVSLGFAIMLGMVDAPHDAYDTAGDEIVEMADLAQRIRAHLGCPHKAIVRDENLMLCEDRYVGDFQDFSQLASDAKIYLSSLDEQIDDTAGYLRETTR